MTNHARYSLPRPYKDASMKELLKMQALYLRQVERPTNMRDAYKAADELATIENELKERA